MFDFVGKVKMINVRLSEKTHEEFRIAAELRGASMSSLLHQFIVKTIREEKDIEPKAFSKPIIDLDNEIAYNRPKEDFDLSEVTDYQMKGKKKVGGKKIEDAMKKAWDSQE